MFRFKQFAVRQDRCPMKVGTDGVLLGAWAPVLPSDRRVLDIGTGTGLIALMMAQRMPQARIAGVDIDDVSQARENADASPWGARLEFHRCPVQEFAAGGAFDLIVSNPPYVPQSDRAAMHVNVRDYEPPEALFVPDDDPLRFYRAIGRAARRLLRPDGRLWFEIYERLADETARLLADEGFGDIAVRRDINDKPRILCCTARK